MNTYASFSNTNYDTEYVFFFTLWHQLLTFLHTTASQFSDTNWVADNSVLTLVIQH